MDLIFDLTYLNELGAQNPFIIMWELFKMGGWVIILIVLVKGGFSYYRFNACNKWWSKQKPVLLAIDLPKENLTGPKVMENILSVFAGMHGSLNKWETYIENADQHYLSLELVSIEGYIQYLIWVSSEKFRDLVEAAIYSQYPDAEITEVEDYAQYAPNNYPNDQMDIFGSEFVQVKHEIYPIRTYVDFEDSFAKPEEKYRDTMASFLEVLSRVSKGEQVWIQMILVPIDDKWKNAKDKEIGKLIGRKVEAKFSLLEKAIEAPVNVLSTVSDAVIGGVEAPVNKRDDPPTMMLHLTPGEKSVVEAIEKKTSKLGFKCKIRLIYAAPPGKIQKAKIAHPLVGSFKQFNTVDLNAIKPETKRVMTKAHYLFTKRRINKKRERIMKAYKGRSAGRGSSGSGENAHIGSVYNIEEIASLWHFPTAPIKGPLMQKAEVKKAEAPPTLPFVEEEDYGFKEKVEKMKIDQEEKSAFENIEEVKDDKGIIPESGAFEYDPTDKGFEKRFAINKKAVLEQEKLRAEKERKKPVSKNDDDKTPGNIPFVN